ncbi:uncharacterized protein LOC123553248 [Mercenaria mercenaria]|uniref:uncharacterized protein LOC123553248 n=1 Tax=Mercenaria mercenaria TaxID=6596 RepID=UPI00234F248A|nr:uncharacterized protein LOC123553248 [Mercenaria mercenaria]
MATPTSIIKSTQKKRHYCCVCSNFRGKVVDGRTIVLHRFPADINLRRTWIKRVKTVMKKFTFNNNARLCSAHFVDGQMSEKHNVPSVFEFPTKRKLFALSSVSSHQDTTEDDEIFFATPLQEQYRLCDMDMDESELLAYEERGEPTNFSVPEMSNECTSVAFHDYCGVVDLNTISRVLNKNEQTEEKKMTFLRSEGTQSFVETRSFLVQTELEQPPKETREIGIQCKLPEITFYDIAAKDEKVMFYTGLPNAGTFCALFDEMSDAEAQTSRAGLTSKKGRPRQLRVIDEFFLVLMRLRMGLLVEDLAARFHISKSTCSVVINKWIDYLSVKLDFLLNWPTKSVIQNTMPRKFQSAYPSTRVIIDCTEFFTETPQSLINKSLMYSHYKSHMTYKALLGISPSGLITFVSDMWAGGISDKQITRSCGILDLCERGDAIMADKGFLISDLTTPRGLHLIIPPLKHKRFSRREVEETRRIANLRIYVEMAMERVKNFRILQGTIPITISKQLTQILKLCAGLSNLQPPLVLDD